MKNIYRPIASIGMTLSLLGGAVACAPAEAETVSKPVTQRQEVETKLPKSGITHKIIYFSNGSRLIRYSGELNGDAYSDSTAGFNPANMLQTCIGTDLDSQTLGEGGWPPVHAQPVIDYPPCADGKLTEREFKKPK